MKILLHKQIIVEQDAGKHDKEAKISTWPQICLMTQNLKVEDYDECLELEPNLKYKEGISFLQ